MCKKVRIILVVCFLAFTVGCAQIVEPFKVIWGSSTKALEDARGDAISKTYRCSFNDCYDAVLSLARDQKARDKIAEEKRKAQADSDDPENDAPTVQVAQNTFFDVFINNRKKRHIVVMGVPGNVETTEVGIFFSQPTLTTVKLEITSLSSSAKRTLAKIVFNELSLRFSKSQ